MEIKKIYSSNRDDWEAVVHFLIQFTLRFVKYEAAREKKGNSKNLKGRKK